MVTDLDYLKTSIPFLDLSQLKVGVKSLHTLALILRLHFSSKRGTCWKEFSSSGDSRMTNLLISVNTGELYNILRVRVLMGN